MVINEPAHQVPLYGEYDVVVLGGGPAGVLAAASAARHGAPGLLAERDGVLGGMGPAATVAFLARVQALTPAQGDQDHIRIIADINPQIPDRNRQSDAAAKGFDTLYYTAALHTGVLVTPPFVQAALKG